MLFIWWFDTQVITNFSLTFQLFLDEKETKRLIISSKS